MQYPLCRHIHTAGNRCGSPALAGKDLCFFHQRLTHRHKVYQITGAGRVHYGMGLCVELGPIEDRSGIQMALSMVINALSVNQVDVKRANAMLYGLQLASMNLPRKGSLTPEPADIVRATLETPEGLELAEDLDEIPVHSGDTDAQSIGSRS